MLTHGLLDRLSFMKLHGMAQALQDIQAGGDNADLSFEDRLTLMIDHEEAVRASRTLKRRLQVAKLRYPQAAVEDVDFRHKRALSRSSFLALARCEWIRTGYNVLITLEVALSGGLLLRSRDGCLRDLASQHGHFKQVEETEPALLLLGEALGGWGVSDCTIYLDEPVSNSGRLAATMRRIADSRRES